MTTKELIEILSGCPQDAEVGASMSSVQGFVYALRRVATVQDGKKTIVCLDQAQELLSSDELDTRTFKAAGG